MRLGDERESGNFEDRTGRSGGGGFGFGGGGGGGAFGLLFGLVFSRFGIVGVVILLLGYCALSTLGGGGGLGGPVGQTPALRESGSGGSTLAPETATFLRRVLGSTEDQWSQIFAQQGQQYQPTRMVAYSRGTSSGCGAAQAAMGPFYCPTDQSIYIDPTFFDELATRFRASGDFAQAYVIAHEVGHHVQHLTGTLDRAQALQARADRAEGNAVQVRVELQADCYAGIWAGTVFEQGALEPGDLDEAFAASEAVGDDRLQKQAGQRVNPDSFTHGTSEQRREWFTTGYESGEPADCDTFSVESP